MLEAWDDIATDALEFGINYAIRECRTFPKPRDIRDYCNQFKRKLLHGDFGRTQLAEATYTDALADKAFGDIKAMFGDDWGLPSTRRGNA